ncbi:MAG: TetR/AcrR family transcriptional regulator [Dehalococcoidia bacterium]|nr:TetR/AcrR family transcriptional regulator [Dehalococcoidia bacterium]
MAAGGRFNGVGDGTPDRIRRAARELFAEQGYERTTIREIAARAGITDPAVLYYFKSKRGLLTAILEEPTLEPLAPMTSWDPGRVADHFVTVLDDYIDRADLFRVAMTRALADDDDTNAFNRRLTRDFNKVFAPVIQEWCGTDTPTIMTAATAAFRVLLSDIVVGGEPIDGPGQRDCVRERFRRCILLVLSPPPAEGARSLTA